MKAAAKTRARRSLRWVAWYLARSSSVAPLARVQLVRTLGMWAALLWMDRWMCWWLNGKYGKRKGWMGIRIGKGMEWRGFSTDDGCAQDSHGW